MNSNQRVPLLIVIAFGICLGNLLLETARTVANNLVGPLLRGILGKVFNGMDSEYLKLGSFIAETIGIAVVVILLWLVWQKVAEPLIKKNTPEDPKP